MNDCGFKFTITAKKGRVLLQSLCRSVGELEAKLQFERERRETLEGDMDQLRKQLQQTTSQLQKYQAISSPNHSNMVYLLSVPCKIRLFTCFCLYMTFISRILITNQLLLKRQDGKFLKE